MTTLEMLQEAENNDCIYTITSPGKISNLRFTKSRGFFLLDTPVTPSLFNSNGAVEYLNDLFSNGEWIIERPKQMTKEELNKLMVKNFGYKVEII